DRELRQAVLLDEALLDHHHRLGGHHVVASGAESIASAEGNGEAEAERVVRERGGHEVAAGAVRGAAATAEGIAELAVPPRARLLAVRRPRIVNGIGGVIDDG